MLLNAYNTGQPPTIENVSIQDWENLPYIKQCPSLEPWHTVPEKIWVLSAKEKVEMAMKIQSIVSISI